MIIKKVRFKSVWTVVYVLVLAIAWLVATQIPSTPIAYAQCGGQIRAGTAIRSSLNRGSQCDYIFDGNRGDSITIQMTRSTSTLDPYLELFSPGRRIVAYDDDSGGSRNSLISSYVLPEKGRYTVRARSYDNTGYGEFELELRSGTICGGTIPLNKWVNNQLISSRGQSCRYTFDGKARVTISIGMAKETGSSLDAWLDLVDPAGNVVARDDDSYGGSDALINGYRLLKTGQYTIVARSYNDQSTGAFAIYLKYSP